MITEINYDKLADLISEKLAEKMKANEDHTRSFAWARKNLFANSYRTFCAPVKNFCSFFTVRKQVLQLD